MKVRRVAKAAVTSIALSLALVAIRQAIADNSGWDIDAFRQARTTSPYVRLKVAGQEFDKVKVEEMPDMKHNVAAAMADKYFMDMLIRHESHPTVARLALNASAPANAPH